MKINSNLSCCIKLFLKVSFIFCLFHIVGCTQEKKILVESNTINKRIQEKFPIEKSLLLVGQIKLESPNVFFKENMIGIKMNVTGNYLKKNLYGNVSFLAIPYYEDGKFFLNKFKFDHIEIENNEIDLDNKFLAVIEGVIANRLNKVPFYELNKEDFKESMASILLDRIEIDKGNLVLILKY